MTMKPKSAHRYRICGTPVRTGCVTCKIRRVKCDEAKPFCTRCTSTGRKCDGYVPLSQLSNVRKQPPPPKAFPVNPTEDPMEQRMLHFFTTVTAPKLSGDFSADFWQRRVLRACRTEPSIRHAVIAIGAIHQDFISRHENYGLGQDPSIKSFAFRQYTKAISHLHRLMSTQTQQLDITLMSCILFICFDCISGNHDSAIIHLKAGLKILEDIKKKNIDAISTTDTLSAQEWEREFAPLLLGLGVQAASFVNPKYRKDRASLWRMMKEARVPTDPPGTFRSINEARHALETLIADIMSDRTTTEDPNELHKVSRPDGSQAEMHAIAMAEWKTSLDRYLVAYPSTNSKKVENGADVLMVHWLLISIVIDMPQPSTARFEHLVSLCDSIVPQHIDSAYNSSNLGFSTDIGVIAPLFFASLRAPNFAIRRKALDILARSPRREGMWDSGDAVAVAGDALRGQEDLEEVRESISPVPAEFPPAEVRMWDDVSSKSKDMYTWPYSQSTLDQPAPFTHGFPFARSEPCEPVYIQSYSPSHSYRDNYTGEYLELPGL